MKCLIKVMTILLLLVGVTLGQGTMEDYTDSASSEQETAGVSTQNDPGDTGIG
ncbi:MAG: hypothetical protein H0Z32_13920 [Bacillaceae bacterium]|nr:hypothetical protein [Bacillaceae bacterium]